MGAVSWLLAQTLEHVARFFIAALKDESVLDIENFQPAIRLAEWKEFKKDIDVQKLFVEYTIT